MLHPVVAYANRPRNGLIDYISWEKKNAFKVVLISHIKKFTVSLLGQDEGYFVKYSPLPDRVPGGKALKKSQRQRAIFDPIS